MGSLPDFLLQMQTLHTQTSNKQKRPACQTVWNQVK